MEVRTVDRVREAFDTSPFEEQGAAFCFTETMAAILDAAQGLKRPQLVNELFRAAWQNYAAMWNVEHQAALEEILGEERFQQLKDHDETATVTRQIFERIGGLQPGQGFGDVDINDILEEAGIT